MEEIAVAKKANQIVKEVLAKLEATPTKEADFNNFKNVPEIFNNAAGMLEGNKTNIALLNLWMASQATNAVFLLWRRGIEHADIEKEWRELPATDELLDVYNALLDEDKKEAEKLEAERRTYMDGQHKLDIFKAILNGLSKEEAEAKQKEYQDKLAKSLGA